MIFEIYISPSHILEFVLLLAFVVIYAKSFGKIECVLHVDVGHDLRMTKMIPEISDHRRSFNVSFTSHVMVDDSIQYC